VFQQKHQRKARSSDDQQLSQHVLSCAAGPPKSSDAPLHIALHARL